MKKIDAFIIGAQISGKDADAVIYPPLREIKRVLSLISDRTYSKEVGQFSFVLRVDGSVRSWGFEGTDAIELNRKERYVTADVGVPKSWWEGLPPETVSENLKRGLRKTLLDMLAFLKHKGVTVDDEKVIADFNEALVRVSKTGGKTVRPQP